MAKEKANKVDLISITYKVGTKFYMADIQGVTSKTKKAKGLLKAYATTVSNGENSCGEGCRCVGGIVQRFITFGGINQWINTNEPC